MKLLILSLALCSIACQNKQVEENINMYSNTWDEIINNGNLDFFNEDNFDSNITILMSPENVSGIENVKTFYSNYLSGFSNIEFTIIDIFGQGDKLVKHWNFKGKHTGDFFGIPATNKSVDIDGTTLVKMKNGKISEEQDFMDNLSFMGQLGIDPYLNPNNTGIIQKLYDNFAKGDIEAVGAVVDANVVWNEAENFPFADGNPYIGFDAVVEGVFSRIGSDWDYWNLTDISLNEMTNNKILVTGRYKAKYKKNGAVIDLQMAHLWTLKDNKVISFQQYADTKGIVDAMNK